jgi:hypothetical protein
MQHARRLTAVKKLSILPGKASRLHAMVHCQYAESMVKLVENAVF